MTPQTPTEEFVLQQVSPGLRPGESVLAIAYLPPVLSSNRSGVFIDAATKMASFATLTDQRLVFVQTRIGAFAPLLENHGMTVLERSQIRGVYVTDQLFIELANGTLLYYQAKSSVKQVPTQGAFFQLLTTSFPRSTNAAQLSRSNQRSRYIALVAGLLFAAVYAWLRFRHH